MSDLQDTITQTLNHIHDLKIPCFIAVPSAGLPVDMVEDYWASLDYHDTLKYRWSDEKLPTTKMATNQSMTASHMYSMVSMPEGLVVSEFSLGPFSGRCAQVHFSMHPSLGTDVSLELSEKIADSLLQYWPDMAHPDEPMLQSIFGITPKSNRAACIFIQKVGFKSLGVMPGGTQYLGETDDALLTLKTRN
ncbi:MAG: hypothetical protein KAG66_17625 [Methylococcales bacterium]|nr:hypothetical protein [Methylococcales bacterium]